MLEVEGKKKVHKNDRKTLGTSFASLSLLHFLPTQNINTFLDVIKLSGFSLFSPVSSTVLYPYSFFLSLSLSSQNQFTPDRVLLSCKFSPLLLMDSQEEREGGKLTKKMERVSNRFTPSKARKGQRRREAVFLHLLWEEQLEEEIKEWEREKEMRPEALKLRTNLRSQGQLLSHRKETVQVRKEWKATKKNKRVGVSIMKRKELSQREKKTVTGRTPSVSLSITFWLSCYASVQLRRVYRYTLFLHTVHFTVFLLDSCPSLFMQMHERSIVSQTQHSCSLSFDSFGLSFAIQRNSEEREAVFISKCSGESSLFLLFVSLEDSLHPSLWCLLFSYFSCCLIVCQPLLLSDSSSSRFSLYSGGILLPLSSTAFSTLFRFLLGFISTQQSLLIKY